MFFYSSFPADGQQVGCLDNHSLSPSILNLSSSHAQLPGAPPHRKRSSSRLVKRDEDDRRSWRTVVKKEWTERKAESVVLLCLNSGFSSGVMDEEVVEMCWWRVLLCFAADSRRTTGWSRRILCGDQTRVTDSFTLLPSNRFMTLLCTFSLCLFKNCSCSFGRLCQFRMFLPSIISQLAAKCRIKVFFFVEQRRKSAPESS